MICRPRGRRICCRVGGGLICWGCLMLRIRMISRKRILRSLPIGGLILFACLAVIFAGRAMRIGRRCGRSRWRILIGRCWNYCGQDNPALVGTVIVSRGRRPARDSILQMLMGGTPRLRDSPHQHDGLIIRRLVVPLPGDDVIQQCLCGGGDRGAAELIEGGAEPFDPK